MPNFVSKAVFGVLLTLSVLTTTVSSASIARETDESLLPCGDAFYIKSKYTCYDGDFLCPVVSGEPTLRCNRDCYLPEMYSCVDNHLVLNPTRSSTATASGATSTPSASASCAAQRFHLSEPPYENYFLSDCNLAFQVVVTSPLPDSNLSVIGPRLLIAWPAGNSGVVAFFKPKDGANGTLGISLEPSPSTGNDLESVFEVSDSGSPRVGVSGVVKLNVTSTLTLAVLGSIRTIRDFTEGPSLLQPSIQNAIQFADTGNGTVELARLWLDNTTTTTLTFTSTSGSQPKINNRTIDFEPGTYTFTASYNYPQLKQLTTQSLLNPQSLGLQAQSPDQVSSLSFLSYTDKLLAGAWRFLTYFGRDTMISLLLMQPILSVGEGSATEAVIGAVLERLNRTDGSAAHEETIGDYATYLNLQNNVTTNPTAPTYDYKMVDTDYYLPIVLSNYLIANPTGASRATAFLSKTASVNPANAGLSYADLMLLNAEKIISTSAPFASSGGQVKANLIHLKEGQVVGQWRDSEFGIGGGRIPYDVNTALVPAALQAIASLAGAGFFPTHPDWNETAALYAQIWEEKTLPFFEVSIPAPEARDLVQGYVDDNSLPFPSQTESIPDNSTVTFYGLALDGNNNQSLVKVMNTDDCFRLFLLNSSSSADESAFLSQVADHILTPFPVGLRTEVGLFVANPAYGGDEIYARNFTQKDYHGTVVWSWQLAMMAAGLERRIEGCRGVSEGWCGGEVYKRVVEAYNVLWDVIEANKASLSSEVWSWTWSQGRFETEPLGAFSSTESDVVQLWSLTFLAVTRDESLKS